MEGEGGEGEGVAVSCWITPSRARTRAKGAVKFAQGIVPQLRLFDPGRHEYPNLPAYLIFDAQYLKKYSFANRPVGSEVPQPVSRAGNLPGLAAQLGIDGAALEKTVRRFNGLVERGPDEDFRRGEPQWKLASSTAS